MKTRLLFLLFLLLGILSLAGCFGGSNPTLDWSVTPDRRTISPGDQTTFTIQVRSKAHINDTVNLRVTGVPTGATATFTPQLMPDTATTSTLTITTTTALAVGTYTLTVFAHEVGGDAESSDTVQLIVTDGGTDPDFTLEVDPLSYLFDAELGKTFTFFIRPLNGFTGDVAVSLSGVPTHVTVQQAVTPSTLNFPNSGGKGGTFVLRMNTGGFAQPPVDITVTATSGGITHVGTIHLSFPI